MTSVASRFPVRRPRRAAIRRVPLNVRPPPSKRYGATRPRSGNARVRLDDQQSADPAHRRGERRSGRHGEEPVKTIRRGNLYVHPAEEEAREAAEVIAAMFEGSR